jgi:hypothetical protein
MIAFLVFAAIYLALGAMLAAGYASIYGGNRLLRAARFIWMIAFWFPIVGYELLGGGL